MINKSIIENFTLADESEVYIQCSMNGRVTVSFDSTGSSFSHVLTLAEAKELASKLNQVIEESN